eukprot:365837-Chlamydomonas_euryale.AAC.6
MLPRSRRRPPAGERRRRASQCEAGGGCVSSRAARAALGARASRCDATAPSARLRVGRTDERLRGRRRKRQKVSILGEAAAMQSLHEAGSKGTCGLQGLGTCSYGMSCVAPMWDAENV